MLTQLSVDRSMVFLIRRVQYGKGWETLENKAFQWPWLAKITSTSPKMDQDWTKLQQILCLPIS